MGQEFFEGNVESHQEAFQCALRNLSPAEHQDGGEGMAVGLFPVNGQVATFAGLARVAAEPFKGRQHLIAGTEWNSAELHLDG